MHVVGSRSISGHDGDSRIRILSQRLVRGFEVDLRHIRPAHILRMITPPAIVDLVMDFSNRLGNLQFFIVMALLTESGLMDTRRKRAAGTPALPAGIDVWLGAPRPRQLLCKFPRGEPIRIRSCQNAICTPVHPASLSFCIVFHIQNRPGSNPHSRFSS